MQRDRRCLDYQKEIKEKEAKLFSVERAQSKALLRDRVRFLRLLKSGACGSLAEAGRQIGLKLGASEKLWRKYREEGLMGLLNYPFKGYQGKLTAEQQDCLEEALQQSSVRGLTESCQYVEEHFGAHYSLSGMHYVLRRLQIKKKTARPTHVNKSEAAEKRFKKSLSRPETALL
jgi:transposase